jgi:hypothetical protein
MADTKISALPNATTPLAGTELVPLVQSGANAKATITDVRSGLQTTLVSGTSIKTVNSTTLLGSGDLPLFSGGLVKVSVVASLPGSPDPNTLYIIA